VWTLYADARPHPLAVRRQLRRQAAARGSLLWPAIARDFERVHPMFGRYQAYGASVCATWPMVTNEQYDGP